MQTCSPLSAHSISPLFHPPSLCPQVLRQIANIVREAHLPVWLRPYDIVATSLDGGLLEAIPDTVSLDALRRNDPRCVHIYHSPFIV